MNFLSQVSPRKAYSDLRLFLAQEQPFKLLFLALALVPTVGLVVALMLDGNRKSAPPPPQIIYVESWPLDRSMAVILAEREERRVKREARDRKVRDSYKALGRMVGMDVEEIEAQAQAEQATGRNGAGVTGPDDAEPSRAASETDAPPAG